MNKIVLILIGIGVIIGISFVVFYGVYVVEMKPNTIIPEDTNFTLYVSNQSTDHRTVSIRVMIDEELEIDRYFDVGNQHQIYPFYFELDKGAHTIKIDSKDASYQEEFTIDDELWMSVAYWYDKEDHEAPITIVNVSDGPIGFQ